MDWEDYSQRFTAAAKDGGFDKEYIDRCLSYASRLSERGLPVIYSLEHLSRLVGIDESYLHSVAYLQERYYRDFNIQKKQEVHAKFLSLFQILKVCSDGF